jgi:hypothetical protein
MKTKSKEVIIKDIEYDTLYGNSINNEIYYVYKIETNKPLNANALEHVITETEKIPERLDEFMVLHGIGQSEIVEFLNNNYKKQ